MELKKTWGENLGEFQVLNQFHNKYSDTIFFYIQNIDKIINICQNILILLEDRVNRQ